MADMQEGNLWVRQPVASSGNTNDRWGTLSAPLAAQTLTPVVVNEYKFQQGSPATAAGTWVLTGKTFLTIDRCLPTGKTIPAGKWVGCSKVSKKVWCVEVVECP